MKRVLIVSRCAWTLYTFRAGLIRYLIAEGYEVHAAGDAADGYAEQVRSTGAVFHDVPVSRSPVSPIGDLRLTFRLRALISELRPSIVHNFTVKPVIYGSFAAQLSRGCRVINTITGLGYAFTGGRRWIETIVVMLYRLAIRRSAAVFFQNKDDLEVFWRRKIISRKSGILVPGSGVDLVYYSVSERAGQDQTPVRILFVGRLLADKGIVEFLQAAKQLRLSAADVSCEIVGELDERNPTCISRDLINTEIAAGNVKWHGKTNDVRSFLARVDIVVLPSYREGTPRSLLEAAAMGLPIITTDAPGCRDVVQHEYNGLLVPVADCVQLAEAMIRLAADSSERARMGRNGRRKMEVEFDQTLVFDSTLAAYRADDFQANGV